MKHHLDVFVFNDTLFFWDYMLSFILTMLLITNYSKKKEKIFLIIFVPVSYVTSVEPHNIVLLQG